MHPSLEYALVCCIAAAACFVLTPLARVVAVWWGAVARPRDRDVHAVAIPRMGGVAICAGFALAIGVAREMPTLRTTFTAGPDFGWIVVAAVALCALGVLDDRFELDSLTKLAGQVTATGVMVVKGGVQMAFVYVPGVGMVSLGQDLGIPLTILFAVLVINALNFVDGLDGLAAGVSVISSLAFFVFSYHLAIAGYAVVWAAPTLLTAALGGACLGFLPHNFWPARIFMGDSGSMVVGLLLAAAATTTTTSVGPDSLGFTGSLALYLPLLIPVAVLAVPFIDLLLAVARRVRRRQSPFAPDKEHLHHRMLEIGHTHRRAVLLLYFWSGLLAAAGVGLSVSRRMWPVLTGLGVLAVLGVLLSVVPRLRPRPSGPGAAVPPPASLDNIGGPPPRRPAPPAAPGTTVGADRGS